ncbi:lysylphosphatidylglycerol synthase domain-containing protein [Roseivirga misakiensis]|nr:lysylphosphatidylglycerol synthase domain-containing protein [Roseivirga misakiensis]
MDSEKALKTLNVRSVWIPVIIGLGIVVALAITDDRLNVETLGLIKDISPIALVVSVFVLLSKDLVNMARLKFLSKKSVFWASAIRIIFLWEFAIAVTPPVLGATGVLVYIMFREKLSFGTALAYTLLLATFDNLFFLTASPLAILISNGAVLPDSTAATNNLGQSIRSLFWLSYALIAVYTSFMLSAVLLFPKAIRRLTAWVMNLKWLKKWRLTVLKQADDLLLVSQILKGKSVKFWLTILGITYLVWILKYSVLNGLVSGFAEPTLMDQGILLGRHLIMWIVLLVSPAPGNAGAAELIFPLFFEDYLKDYTFICLLIWRLLSYYPYLLIGALILPKWIRGAKS